MQIRTAPHPPQSLTLCPSKPATEELAQPAVMVKQDSIARSRDLQTATTIASTFARTARAVVAQTVTRLLGEMRRDGVTNPQQQADILGQTALETSLGQNMTEPAQQGANYENARDLGNTQPGDGVRFRGRGFVQITGRASYTYWSHRLGVDLVGHPELASRPDVAAKIAVLGMRDGTFTGMTKGGALIAGGGRKLGDYTDPGGNVDFYNSRQIVNGHDRAGELARTASEYLHDLAQTR